MTQQHGSLASVLLLIASLREVNSLAGKHQAFSMMKGKRAALLNAKGDTVATRSKDSKTSGNTAPQSHHRQAQLLEEASDGVALCTQSCSQYAAGVTIETDIVAID